MTPEKQAPLQERVAKNYSLLCDAAQDLNYTSDALGKAISEIDVALKKLNLGVPAWVTFSGNDGTPTESWYWSDAIGYAKVGSTWGICLRKTRGDYNSPDEDQEEIWPFNDAPRAMRLTAIDKIPELLERLADESTKTAKKIRAKLGDVEAVANALRGTKNKGELTPAHIKIAPRPLTNPQLERFRAASIRDAVTSALTGAGHASAAELLSRANWGFDGTLFHVQVPGIGKKMLAIIVNAAAEKVIREELLRLSAPPRFTLVPGEKSASAPGQNAQQSTTEKGAQ